MSLQTHFAETEYAKLTRGLQHVCMTVVKATGARRHTSLPLKPYFSVIS